VSRAHSSHRFRSRAQSLYHFALPVERRVWSSETPFSLSRAPPPIPPRGRALERRRGLARARGQASGRATSDGLGTPGRSGSGDARGNSSQGRQTFFRLSGPVWGVAPHGHEGLPCGRSNRAGTTLRILRSSVTRANEARRRGGRPVTPGSRSASVPSPNARRHTP